MSTHSSANNDSVPHENPHIPFFESYLVCVMSKPSSIILAVYSMSHILLHLPLSVSVLFHGHQQWRKKHTTSSTTSHSDTLTYHVVIMELMGVVGCFLNVFAIYSEKRNVAVMGILIFSFTWFGEMIFHVLTCVERYLAIVHPIIYINLRNDRGIRIRNTCIGCVWLLCLGGTSLVPTEWFALINFYLVILCVIVVSFCSISAQCVLIRPRPGKQGRERVDHSKQKAFYAILVILGVLLLRFSWGLFWAIIYLSEINNCVVMSIDVWINLPSSVVLPLLFLYRAGKLVCCKNVQKISGFILSKIT